jgi:hypothetical protein
MLLLIGILHEPATVVGFWPEAGLNQSLAGLSRRSRSKPSPSYPFVDRSGARAAM